MRVNLAAIEHNVEKLKRHLGTTKVLALLKNDAYGLGLQELAIHLGQRRAQQPDPLVPWIGLGTVDEARQLRGEAIDARVLILDGVSTLEVPDVVEQELVPLVWDIKIVRELGAEATGKGRKAEVHVKVNTGLTRLGVEYEELESFLREIVTVEGVVVSGICSHVATARDKAEEQIRRFDKAIAKAKEVLGVQSLLTHIAASSSLQNLQLVKKYDMVRFGGSLFGIIPGDNDGKISAHLDLRAAITVDSEIIQIRDVDQDTYVTYNATRFPRQKGKVAIVRLGYADGFPTHDPNDLDNRVVLVHTKKCKILGEVYMGLLTVDVTEVSGVSVGDRVRIIGEVDGGPAIGIAEFAFWYSMRPYEVLTRFGSAMPRRYLK